MLVDLVIALTDKVNPDPILDLGCIKVGDLICWELQGHQWSAHELSSPNWRIVTIDILPTTLNALMAPEDGDPGIKKLRRRKYRLDLSKLAKLDRDRKNIKGKVTQAELMDAAVLL